jgi:hypothetical protein
MILDKPQSHWTLSKEFVHSIFLTHHFDGKKVRLVFALIFIPWQSGNHSIPFSELMSQNKANVP